MLSVCYDFSRQGLGGARHPGRYAATPHRRHTGAGEVEWPPSPWRIARALLAIYHTRRPDLPADVVEAVVARLSTPAVYRMPPTSRIHVRQPEPQVDGKIGLVDRVSLAIGGDLHCCWPDVALSDEETEVLRVLLDEMPYLGTADSHVRASLSHWDGSDPDAAADASLVSGPLDRTRLLAAAGDVTDAHAACEALRAVAADKVRPRPRAKAVGRSHPLGSRQVLYHVRQQTSAPRGRREAQRRVIPTVARYAVCGRVVPSLHDAVIYAERVRARVMGCSRKINGETCSAVFSGHASDGQALGGDHRHAHFICEGGEKISHVTVVAPGGFANADVQALQWVSRVHGPGGHDLRLLLEIVGGPHDFADSAVLASSCVWESATPYVPARYSGLKRSQQSNPEAIARWIEADVRRELGYREWLSAAGDVSVKVLPTGDDWHLYRTDRKGAGSRASSRGYRVLIECDHAIDGPVAIGYGAHSGLGVFVPAE